MTELGWFILNAKDAEWLDGDLGRYTGFESKGKRFPQLGMVAQKHGAAPAEETSDPKQAYEPFSFERGGYKEGWLPD
jgi:hypothetical protein